MGAAAKHVPSDGWYVTAKGQQMGPYTWQQLQDWLAQGHMPANTPVWHEYLENWQPLNQLMSSLSQLTATPAPAAAAAAATATASVSATASGRSDDSAEAKWFIKTERDRLGPFTKDQIFAQVASGDYKADVPIWAQGMPHLQPAAKLWPDIKSVERAPAESVNRAGVTFSVKRDNEPTESKLNPQAQLQAQAAVGAAGAAAAADQGEHPAAEVGRSALGGNFKVLGAPTEESKSRNPNAGRVGQELTPQEIQAMLSARAMLGGPMGRGRIALNDSFRRFGGAISPARYIIGFSTLRVVDFFATMGFLSMGIFSLAGGKVNFMTVLTIAGYGLYCFIITILQLSLCSKRLRDIRGSQENHWFYFFPIIPIVATPTVVTKMLGAMWVPEFPHAIYYATFIPLIILALLPGKISNQAQVM